MEEFRKLEDGNWLFSESREGEEFCIESITCPLPLAEVYSGVEWTETKEP